MLPELFYEVIELRFVSLFLLRGECAFDHDASALSHEFAQRFTVGCFQSGYRQAVIEAIEKVWCCIDDGSVEIENDDGLGISSRH